MKQINTAKKCYIVLRYYPRWKRDRQLLISLKPLPPNDSREPSIITVQTIKFKTVKELREKLSKARKHFETMKYGKYYPYNNLSNISECATLINHMIRTNNLENFELPAHLF